MFFFFHGNCIHKTSPPTAPRCAGVPQGHAAPGSAPSRTRSLPKHLALQTQEVGAPQRPALGGTFPTDASRSRRIHPWDALCCCLGGLRGAGAAGVVSPRRRRWVPSGTCGFAAVSRQPGSINLGAETRPFRINSRGKLTPTRTTFIPTNYLCRGAAIKHASAATAV